MSGSGDLTQKILGKIFWVVLKKFKTSGYKKKDLKLIKNNVIIILKLRYDF